LILDKYVFGNNLWFLIGFSLPISTGQQSHLVGSTWQSELLEGWMQKESLWNQVKRKA
jgi:hypothetical protein